MGVTLVRNDVVDHYCCHQPAHALAVQVAGDLAGQGSIEAKAAIQLSRVHFPCTSSGGGPPQVQPSPHCCCQAIGAGHRQATVVGGSTPAADGTIAVGGGGGIIDARRLTLPVGALAVVVGAGGPVGTPGGVSSLDAVGATPAGAAGAPGAAEFSPTTTSRITGRPVVYGGSGTATSGQGLDGLGVGGGGPAASRGGNGIVVIRYEVAPSS